MQIKPITVHDRDNFNTIVKHPLQSYEWGNFREKTGIKVVRRGVFENNKLINGFQLTIHPLPHAPWTIGYLPKAEVPSAEILEELISIGKENNCIFIQLEPNVYKDNKILRDKEISVNENRKKPFNTLISQYSNIRSSTHPLFTKYTFVLDLTKTEDELLKNMHPKTRYNIKIARKHDVEIKEDNSIKAFEKYWQLTKETTRRQGFYAHTEKYHKLQWENFTHTKSDNKLSSHLITATYSGKILTTMLFFVFHDTLYYPYGASSNEYRNTMHSTLTMWEAIRWGKKKGLKKLDMWGALGENPVPDDPWIGFHTFKNRFGPEHVEFIGSFDLIIDPLIYRLYVAADKIRWIYLKLKKISR